MCIYEQNLYAADRKKSLADIDTIMALPELFDSLPGKLAWDRDKKLVSFKNLESAKTFKAAAPTWRVQYFDWTKWGPETYGN